MTEVQKELTRRSLKTPRAAAVAGILFATLYGTSLVLVRSSISEDLAGDSADWLETNADTISLALNLVPYAGIAFLWFIGVIRDRLGELEDRFFATVFLGSGLLFLCLTFVGTALAGGLMASIGFSLWVTMIFPAWVLAVNVYFLIASQCQESDKALDEKVIA